MTTDSDSRTGERPEFKQIVHSLLGLAQTRLEILGIDLAEEKVRLFRVAFAGLAAMLFGTMALMTLTVLIVATFWDTYRWQALVALMVIYVLAAWWCAARALTRLREAPTMFETTLDEFRKDRELFRKPR